MTITVAVPHLPGGRDRQLWENSGEEFYEDQIAPRLRAGDDVVVDLDPAVGVPSGFMGEFTWRAVNEFGHGVRLAARALKPQRLEDFTYHMERAKRKLPEMPAS